MGGLHGFWTVYPWNHLRPRGIMQISRRPLRLIATLSRSSSNHVTPWRVPCYKASLSCVARVIVDSGYMQWRSLAERRLISSTYESDIRMEVGSIRYPLAMIRILVGCSLLPWFGHALCDGILVLGLSWAYRCVSVWECLLDVPCSQSVDNIGYISSSFILIPFARWRCYRDFTTSIATSIELSIIEKRLCTMKVRERIETNQ